MWPFPKRQTYTAIRIKGTFDLGDGSHFFGPLLVEQLGGWFLVGRVLKKVSVKINIVHEIVELGVVVGGRGACCSCGLLDLV